MSSFATLKIGSPDGSVLVLNIERNDNPTELAMRFIEANRLPVAILEKLTEQINFHMNQANNALANNVSVTSDRLGNGRSEPQSGSDISKHHNLDDDADDFEQSFYRARDVWLGGSKKSSSNEDRTNGIISGLKKSRSDSAIARIDDVIYSENIDTGNASLRSRSPSALSSSQYGTPNRPVHERLFEEATHSRNRLERLRGQVEEERREVIRSSSFIETTGFRSPSTPSRRGRDSAGRPGSAYSSSPSLGAKKRSLSGSALSSSLARTPDGREIAPNEYLYYAHKEWAAGKDASTERLKRQIASEQEERLAQELTLQPRIATAPAMQLQRTASMSSGTPLEVFHMLHSSSFHYASRREEQRRRADEQFEEQHPFMPAITPRSRRIAERRLRARSSERPGEPEEDDRSVFSAATSPDRSVAPYVGIPDFRSPVATPVFAAHTTNDNSSLQTTATIVRAEDCTVGDPPLNCRTESITECSQLSDYTNAPAAPVRDSHASLQLSDLAASPAAATSEVDNPFDRQSRHWRQTSPPTLLDSPEKGASNSSAAETTLFSSDPSSQQQPRRPSVTQPQQQSESSTYRELRESGRLHIEATRSTASISGLRTQQSPAKRVQAGGTDNGKQSARSRHNSAPRSRGGANTGNGDSSNSSGTSMRSQDRSLFDRLYEARHEAARERVALREKHAPARSHIPFVGSSSRRQVERSKDEFFARLYDEFGARKSKQAVAAQLADQRRAEAIKGASFVARRSGAPVSEARVSRAQEKQVVERLLESKQRVAQKVETSKSRHEQHLAQQAQSRFTLPKSGSIANRAHAAALGEIFDVLRVTALLQADETAPGAGDGEGPGSADQDAKKTGLLDTALARPGMLQPRLLADSISAVLASLQPQRVSREDFVVAVQRQMGDGSLPPIGYLLTRPGHGRSSGGIHQAQDLRHLSSEERELRSQCRSRPELVARTTTDQLVKGRYRERLAGQQSIEDSLLSYREYQESRRMERLVAAEKDFRRDCSFEPNTQSPYMITFRRQGPAAVRGATQNRKRSGSAPPRVYNAAPANIEGRSRIVAAADAAVSAVAEIVRKQSTAPREQPPLSSPPGVIDGPNVPNASEDFRPEAEQPVGGGGVTAAATFTAEPEPSSSLPGSGAFSYRRTPAQQQPTPVHRHQAQPKRQLKPQQRQQQQDGASYSSLYSRMRSELYVGSTGAPR